MPRWLTRVLKRIHELAMAGSVRLTFKAQRELVGLGLDLDDVRDVLRSLTSAESAGRLISARTEEWLYLFKPRVGADVIYLKMVVRDDCVVVSFHEDEGGNDENDK